MLKFSVITVVRNGMPFVEQTLDSVLVQTYPHIEYIVIDGASTDGTVDTIRRHERGIAKWISEPDAGIADAFNKGLSYASGDYILFLNADDVLADPSVINRVAEKIVKSNFPALFYGDYDILERNSGAFMYHGRVNFSLERARYGQVIPHPCLFTSKQYFEKYGNFDTTFRLAMDYEWLLRGCARERIVHEKMLVSKIRAGGISTRDQQASVREIILALRKNGYFSGFMAEFRTRFYFFVRDLGRTMLAKLGLYALFLKARHGLKNLRAKSRPTND